MSSLPSARIVIESADNCEDSNTYPSGACGNSPSTNDTSVPSGKLTPAETTEPSAGRSNSADPSAHVAVWGVARMLDSFRWKDLRHEFDIEAEVQCPVQGRGGTACCPVGSADC